MSRVVRGKKVCSHKVETSKFNAIASFHIRKENVGSTVPINRAFLAWVVWQLLTQSEASNGISLIEGHDAVLVTRKSSPENKNQG